MPTQSIASVEAQISNLTSDITALNNQITTKQTAYETQYKKIPGFEAAYVFSKKRYEYVGDKAKLAGKKKKDWQCYDNTYFFPTSGGCYDKEHWDKQWSYFSGVMQKALNAFNTQKGVTSALLKELNDLKGVRDDKVIERDKAIMAKNALMKAEDDKVKAAATAEAITNPEIVKAGLDAKAQETEAKLASNRQMGIWALGIVAFVLIALFAINRFS